MNETKAFRDPQHVKNLADKINALAKNVAKSLERPVQIMEICGGHTHAICRSGIDQLLSKDVEFVHGPGCPVCVLPREAIDQAISIARQPDTFLAAFGDVLRVPGSTTSLLKAKAEGSDVRVLYSPFDALKLAQQNPQKKVVFFAIGFDTTMPSIAQTIKTCRDKGISNLKFLCHHILLMPTMFELLDRKETTIDGFIGPGHVSIVIGSDAYLPIAEKYQTPLVVSGFEPVDILNALYHLLLQLEQGRCEIENTYQRAVSPAGNTVAQDIMAEVFDFGLNANWRGIGQIAGSGVKLKKKYQNLNAAQGGKDDDSPVIDDPIFCSEVLTGKIKPEQCPLFAKHCQPNNPLGALMVSSEGACAAHYQYKQQKSTTG